MNSTDMPSAINGSKYSVCVDVLYWNVGNSRVLVWDLALLVPTAAFLLFLLTRVTRVYERLQRSRSAIFCAFFFLVSGATLISLMRCILSFVLLPESVLVLKLSWLVTRFSLLFVEASFIVFALIGSALENTTKSVLCVVSVTLCVTALYSGVQTVLELGHYYDDSYFVEEHRYDLYEHGGMLFWFSSSALFAVAYGTVLVLRFVPRERLCLTLPRRNTFYWYVGIIGTLNLVQTLGSGLLYFGGKLSALCVVELTSFIYFAFFTPLVYVVFLRGFFKARAAIAFTQRARAATGISARSGSGVSLDGNAPFTYQRVRDRDSTVYASVSLNNDEAMLDPDADRMSYCDDDEQMLAPFDANFYSSTLDSSYNIAPVNSSTSTPTRTATVEPEAYVGVARPPSVEIFEPGMHASRSAAASRAYATLQHADFLAARTPISDNK